MGVELSGRIVGDVEQAHFGGDSGRAGAEQADQAQSGAERQELSFQHQNGLS